MLSCEPLNRHTSLSSLEITSNSPRAGVSKEIDVLTTKSWSLIEVLTTLGNRWTAVFSADVRIRLDDSGVVDAHFGLLSSFLPIFHPA